MYHKHDILRVPLARSEFFSECTGKSASKMESVWGSRFEFPFQLAVYTGHFA